MRAQPLARLLIALMIASAHAGAQPPPQVSAPERVPSTILPGPSVNPDSFQRPVPVPSIIGVSPAEAERRLAAVRLVLQPEQRSTLAPNARVVRQNPEAGRPVPAGTRVVAAFEVPPPQLVPVPSIIGMDAMEARRRLAEAQLVLQLDQARPPEAGAKVIQQRPQPGERVALGTPVLAAFELPRSQLVPVPSIIGADAAEAQRRLAGAHLVLQLDQRPPLLPGARVVWQSPQPGELVPPGERIAAAFAVSQPQLVPVPSIIGDNPAEAEQRLARAQLVLQPGQRQPLNPDAKVVRQNPQPGEQVRRGTQVVAAFEVPPPQLVSVPSIIGTSQAEAERRLAGAQLVLQPEQRPPLSPDAKVARQNPQPGEQVRRGTQVVAAFEVPPPQLVSVPSIIGVDLTEAQRRVAATQLVLQPEQRTPSAPNARVVRQSPQPGQMVAPGTQVVAAFEAPPPQLVSVPSIVGADLAEAQRRLAASRLVLQPEQRTPANAGAKVVQQNPQPGQQVPPGTQVVAAFEVPSSPWTAITWLGGALALVAIGALVGLWRWVARMRKSRPDSRTSSLLRVHARKDPGRPSIQLNNDPAGPAFGIRVTRPPPVITLTEHDHA